VAIHTHWLAKPHEAAKGRGGPKKFLNIWGNKRFKKKKKSRKGRLVGLAASITKKNKQRAQGKALNRKIVGAGKVEKYIFGLKTSRPKGNFRKGDPKI